MMCQKRKNTHHTITFFQIGWRYCNANINVLSRNKDSPDLKVYYSENPENDLINLGTVDKAKNLNNGAYKAIEQDQAIDYLRANYIDLSKLIVLTENRALEELFLFYMIDKHMRIAKENNYDICV